MENIAKCCDVYHLYDLLEPENVDEFLCALDEIAKDRDSFEELLKDRSTKERLLSLAIERGLTMAVQKMLDLFSVSTNDAVMLVKQACLHGNWRCLNLLLESLPMDINSAPLLPIVVKNIGQKPSEIVDFEKCFETLMQMKEIDINQFDTANKSALHYGIKSNNPNIILKLLKRGAYIGVKTEFNRFTISQIDPKLLERHFDTCITSNGLSINDDDFEIQFNFKNMTRSQSAKAANQANELAVIEHISKSKHLRRLMLHPLISGFLSLKWNRLAPFFYVNFLFCTLFAVITITYILAFYSNDENTSIQNCANNDTVRANQVIMSISNF